MSAVRRWLACLPALLAPLAAGAEPVVVSAAPDRVAVTLYRDPARGDRPIDRDKPSAFALIAETPTVTLPPGVVTVRFESVAGGIVPQSAILFGTDPRERNRDAALLSQAGLVDAYTGQQVTLRRTDPATGRTTEERATIRSAADRLVVSTPRGAEALYCSGLAQTLLYPGAPRTLSAKPVLSMTTRDQPGGRVTITLAYIATGFDWDATYVGTLSEQGDTLDLFAWLTMASGDETAFVDATTSAVAGRIARSDETRDDTGRKARAGAERLNRRSNCWPSGTTSSGRRSPRPVMSAAAPLAIAFEGSDIIVTAQRRVAALAAAPVAVTAVAESVGDLKLYRIPVPVTVAARSQKQVAFLAGRRVRGELVYRARVTGDEPDDPELLFRFRNTEAAGVGDPLPAGKVVLYQAGRRGRQLVGESDLADKTRDEEVELVFGAAPAVTLESDDEAVKDGTLLTVTVRNANPFPVRFELEFTGLDRRTVEQASGRLMPKPGKRVLAVRLDPNGTRVLRYTRRDVERAVATR